MVVIRLKGNSTRRQQSWSLRSLLAFSFPSEMASFLVSVPSEFHPVPAESWAEVGKRVGREACVGVTWDAGAFLHRTVASELRNSPAEVSELPTSQVERLWAACIALPVFLSVCHPQGSAMFPSSAASHHQGPETDICPQQTPPVPALPCPTPEPDFKEKSNGAKGEKIKTHCCCLIRLRSWESQNYL